MSFKFSSLKITATILGITMLSLSAFGIEVNIAKGLPYVDVEHGGKTVRIQRIQDTKHKLTNSYAKTSRPCPPFCIQPVHVAKGVKIYGELELLNFLKTDVKNNRGLLIDSRLPQWYRNGTIPGAINIPFTLFTRGIEDPYTQKILELLGAEYNNGKWNFQNAQKLLFFCNGPWCAQSSYAIKALTKMGYPSDKIFYYRGGMQNWQILGLTTVIPEE